MARPASSSPRVPARERIVQTAMRRFYRDGLKATGIDPIIAESGVAKMSFYRHFPSKNNLMAEYLRRRHEEWMVWLTGAVETRLAHSGAGIEVMAEVLREWFDQPDFRGCPFINAQAEAAGVEPMIHEVIQRHQTELEAFLVDLVTRLGHTAPKQTAAAVWVILEGSIVRAQMGGEVSAVCDVCQTLLKKFNRTIRKPETQDEGLVQQLFLPGI